MNNTGNPIPSTGALDFEDNLENLDRAVNSPLSTYTDRLGVSRKSWAGFEADFAVFLAASGFETPVLTYTDGVPLQVDRPTQLLERASDPGTLYSIQLPSSFPVVLSGTWATDLPLLVIRIDEPLRAQLFAPGGAELVGGTAPVIADVAALRAYVGRYDGDLCYLFQYSATAGVGAGKFRRITSASPADNGVTVFAGPGSVRWVREESEGPIDVRWAGAVPAAAYDVGMFDSKDAVARAQTVAGVNGVVHFPLPPGQTEAHYLLNATEINLAGSLISADPGVIIHAPNTRDAEGQKPRTVGDVTFSEEAPVSATVYLTARGENQYPLISGVAAAMAAASATITDDQRKFSFVSDSRAIRVSSLATGAFTLDSTGMTVADTQISWATPAAAGADWQGMEFACAPGAELEWLIHNVTAGGSSGSMFVGLRTQGANGAAAAVLSFRFTIGASDYQVYLGDTLVETVPLANDVDKLTDINGAVRLGIRVGAQGRSARLVLNGNLGKTYTLGSGLAQSILIAANQAARVTIRFKYPIARKRNTPGSTKTLKLAFLGDSQTRGARSTTEWPRLLQAYGSHMPGIGEITDVSNQAVSGVSAAGVAANIGDYTLTGFDYVLVLLGTNDVQGGGVGGEGALFSAITTIGNAIVAAGAVPIFGVFPQFTSSVQTGNGVTTANQEYIPNYQMVVRERVLNNGWELADADDFFGNNYGFPGSFDSGLSTGWFHDNIHPNTKGQIAIAGAFAAALSRSLTKPVEGCFAALIKPVGAFTATDETNRGLLKVVVTGNVAYLSGAVAGGAANQTIASLPVWARPHKRSTHAVFARTGGAQVLAGLEIRNDGNLVSGTLAWGTEQADLSVSYHV